MSILELRQEEILAKQDARKEFDELVTVQQDIQKANPFGSTAHRAAYAEIRRLVLAMHGTDIGDYED